MKRRRQVRRRGHADMLPGMEDWAAKHKAERPKKEKVIATSFERYNGGAKVKREWGSSTITRFYVHWVSDKNDASRWEKIEGFGPTPGDRRTFAINEFLRRHAA
jgi:hypothetical protein